MHLPDIQALLAEPDGTWTLDLHVARDHPHFDGHFPGLPILPGVVQLDWAVHLARQHIPGFPAEARFAGMELIKFQAVVGPDSRLRLSLSWDAASGRLGFRFTQGERACSSGRLTFEPAP